MKRFVSASDEPEILSEYYILRLARQRAEEKWDKADDNGDEVKAELYMSWVEQISEKMKVAKK